MQETSRLHSSREFGSGASCKVQAETLASGSVGATGLWDRPSDSVCFDISQGPVLTFLKASLLLSKAEPRFPSLRPGVALSDLTLFWGLLPSSGQAAQDDTQPSVAQAQRGPGSPGPNSFLVVSWQRPQRDLVPGLEALSVSSPLKEGFPLPSRLLSLPEHPKNASCLLSGWFCPDPCSLMLLGVIREQILIVWNLAGLPGAQGPLETAFSDPLQSAQGASRLFIWRSELPLVWGRSARAQGFLLAQGTMCAAGD